MTTDLTQPFPGKALCALARQASTLGLVLLLCAQPALALAAAPAEIPPAATFPEAPLPETQSLQIEILDGEGALNNIRQRTAREPIVQVQDENHKPVAGALVLFTINPGSGGASGLVNGLSTFSVSTGLDGKATLRGLKPNNISGQFTINVAATLGAIVATAIIHQQNQTGIGPDNNSQSQTGTTVRHSIFRGATFKTVLIVGATVGGGVLVGVLATRGANGASITAGSGTVTHP